MLEDCSLQFVTGIENNNIIINNNNIILNISLQARVYQRGGGIYWENW